jgi:RNA polymerase sigma-70 factor (ECF subfamily)
VVESQPSRESWRRPGLWVAVACGSMTDEPAICKRYSGRIRAYGLRHLRDGAAAEDLVQQVLLVLLTALREGRLEEPERIDGYVIGICRYTIMDIRRGRARQQRIANENARLLEAGYEAPQPLDHRRLEECLGGLESRDRAIVLATFVDDRNADEIGESMALSAGNVRVIRHRALARLQDCMGEAA